MPTHDPRLETCWALLGPSRRPLTCGIYQTDMGLEVRVGYGERPFIYSTPAAALDNARTRATQLRHILNARAVFDQMIER